MTPTKSNTLPEPERCPDPCSWCDDREAGRMAPSRLGSSLCKSGSIASGGTNEHCTCDTCFLFIDARPGFP